MATVTLRGKGQMNQIAASVRNAVVNSGMSCELVGSNTNQVNGVEVQVLVFEKYFMRNSSRASLTVVLTGYDGDISAVCIGSGGGQGAVFNFSWGAEEDFARDAEHALRSMGFR